ncbi:MAG: VCBS repeat-containing protein [Polyangiaceae bacterium]
MMRSRRALSRSPLSALFVGLFATGLLSCTKLTSLDEQVCGNGVIDKSIGEDCDGPTSSEFACRPPDVDWPCSLSCSPTGTCPTGYGCGADNVCRLPLGTFASKAFAVGPSQAQELYSGNFDNDGRQDILGVEPGRARINFVSETGMLTQTSLPVLTRPAVGHLGPLANPDKGSSIDTTDDLVVALNIGVGAFLSNGDETFTPTTYGSIAFGTIPLPIVPGKPAVESNVEKAVPIALEAVPSIPGDEIGALLGVTPTDGTISNDGFFVGFNAAGNGVILIVKDGAPLRLAGPPVWTDFDGDGSQDIVFPVKPPAGSPPDFQSKVNVYRTVVHTANGDELMKVGNGVDPVMAQIDAGGPVSGPAFVYDVNGDGHTDLLITVKLGGKSEIHVAYGLGDGRFHSQVPDPPPAVPDMVALLYTRSESFPIALGDYDGDVYPDLVTSKGLFIGKPGATMPLDLEQLYQSKRDWVTAYVTDINGDGHPDVAACSDGAPDIDLLIGNEDAYPNPLQISTDGTVANLVVGDFDGDLVNDLAFQDALSSQSSLLQVSYGRTSGGPETPVEIGRFKDIQAIGAGNTLALGVDSITDLGVISTISDVLSLSFFPGAGNRLMQTPYLLSTNADPDKAENGKINIPLATQLGFLRARDAANGEEVEKDVAIIAYAPPDITPQDGVFEQTQKTLKAFRLWGLFGAGDGLFEAQETIHCKLPEGAVALPQLSLATSIMFEGADPAKAAPTWLALPFVTLPSLESGFSITTMVASATFDTDAATCAVDGEGAHYTEEGHVLLRTRMIDLNGNGKPEIVGVLATFSDGYLQSLVQSNSTPGEGGFQGIKEAQLVVVWDGDFGSGPTISFYQPDGQPAEVNDFAVGDIDGDGRPEVLLAGRGLSAVYSISDDGKSFKNGPPLTIDIADARAVTLADADGDGALDLAVSSGSQVQIYKGDTKAAVDKVAASGQ